MADYLWYQWDLIDYGLRWYQPGNGRFINRDPLGEAGGLNLYEAFSGDPINVRDMLGLDPCVPSEGEHACPENNSPIIDLAPLIVTVTVPEVQPAMAYTLNMGVTYTWDPSSGSSSGGSGGSSGGGDAEGDSNKKSKKKNPDKKCYAYVSVDPATGKEEFFTLTGDLAGQKVAVLPNFDIQGMVDAHLNDFYPTIWDMKQWGQNPANNPKTINSVYQHAGNLAYRAVGSALDIEFDELSQAAGYLQRDPQPEWGQQPTRRTVPAPIFNRQGFDVFTGGDAPFYGNDPVDHFITEAGFNATEQGKKIEVREVPCDQVGL